MAINESTEFQSGELSVKEKIIESILRGGLKGSIEIRNVQPRVITSRDLSPRVNRVDGVIVNPKFHLDNSGIGLIPRISTGDSFRYLGEEEKLISDSQLRLLMLDEVLHKGNSSVFGVIIERQGERIDELGNVPVKELEERVANSFLVATAFQDVGRTNDCPRDKLEYPVIAPVLPERFQFVLVPRPGLKKFTEIADKVSFPREVYGVDLSEKTLLIPRVAQGRNIVESEVPVRIVVPDYYNFLVSRLGPNLPPLWIHGVRLPPK